MGAIMDDVVLTRLTLRELYLVYFRGRKMGHIRNFENSTWQFRVIKTGVWRGPYETSFHAVQALVSMVNSG